MKRVLKKIIDMYYKIFADSIHSNIMLNSPAFPIEGTYIGMAGFMWMNVFSIMAFCDLFLGTHLTNVFHIVPHYLQKKLYFLHLPEKFFFIVFFIPFFILVYFTIVRKKDWILENYPYRKRKYLIRYLIITVGIFWGLLIYASFN